MNNMSKYFDQMWKKRYKKKKNEENHELSKSFSNIENVENPNKSKVKEPNRQLECLNLKKSQLDKQTPSLSSQHSSISKETNIPSFEELDVASSKDRDTGTKIENIKFEDLTTHSSEKFHKNRSSRMEPLVQASEMEPINEAFYNMEAKALKLNCQNLHNGSEKNSVNLEDELIHTEGENFDLQKWIDKQIDYNSQLYSLDVNKKTGVVDKQFESYFNSKFDEKQSSLQDIIRGHLGNKIPYEKGKGVCLEHLGEKSVHMTDVDIGSMFEKSKSNENGMALDSKHKSLNELNESNTDSDSNASSDENDHHELYNYEVLSDDGSDIEDGFSSQDLPSLNNSCELHSHHLSNLHPSKETNCLNVEIDAMIFQNDGCCLNSEEGCKFTDGRQIPVEISDKVRFEKTLFYDSISSVQPYFQDNLEGPISLPSLKVESAHVSNIQGISPCSSPKPDFIDRSVEHQDFKRLLPRSRSLKEIVLDNKEHNTSIGLRHLAEETQEFLEKMKEKSSLHLSKCQQVANEVIQISSQKLKEDLETMYKLDNDLQDMTKNKATTPMKNVYDGEMNIQNSPPQQQMRNEVFKSPRNEKKLSRNTCKAIDTQEIKKKKPKKANDKILRNIKLDPNARYYKLTEEEEELVERILAQPDTFDDMINDGCSNTSYASTGYDFDENDAKRIAEINTELEHLELQLYDSCSISNRAISSQCGTSSKMPSISTKEENSTTRTRKSTSHICNKIQKDYLSTMSVNNNDTKVKHYLEEQREHRECQKELRCIKEEIDRKLKELETMELPKLSEEELQALIMECKKEQGLSSIESSAMLYTTSQVDPNLTSDNPSHSSHGDTQLKYDQQVVVTECGTVHMVNPFTSDCDCQ